MAYILVMEITKALMLLIWIVGLKGKYKITIKEYDVSPAVPQIILSQHLVNRVVIINSISTVILTVIYSSGFK